MQSNRNTFGEPCQMALGIDVSKNELVCCISMINTNNIVKVNGTHKFENTSSGIRALAAWIKGKNKLPNQPLSICVEPTSTYHEKVLYSTQIQDCNVRFFVVQPNRAKAYAQSIGQNSKNDKADAKILARLSLTDNHLLREYEALPEEVREIRDLLRQRAAIQEQKTALSNQKQAYISGGEVKESVVSNYENMLKLQAEMVDGIEKTVEQLSKKQSDFADNCKRLMTIKGVHLITAATILAEFNHFKNFQNISQVVSWAGLNIVENQSGKRVGRSRISKKGNKYVRRALYCPATVHVREKGCFRETYRKLREEKAATFHQAIVPIMRKLLILSFSMTKTKTDYCPDKHHERVAKSRTITPRLAAL